MKDPRSALHVPLSAVLLVVVAVGLFTAADTLVKSLAQRNPIPVLLWVRYSFQAVVTVLWLGPKMGSALVRTSQPKVQIVRGVILCVSSFCFVEALKWLPLADATAINYFTPVLVVLLSVMLLKERMTGPRWAFVVAGFAGMLLIVRPGASILHGAALLAFATACFYAVFQLLTRKLRGDDPRVTLFYPALCSMIITSLIVPWFGWGTDMSWSDIALTCIIGALATVAHFLFILAFQRAPASGLTAFTYVQLIWAMVAGWLVFGQFPDRFTFAGIGIIAGSGLLLAWHERRRLVVSEAAVVD